MAESRVSSGTPALVFRSPGPDRDRVTSTESTDGSIPGEGRGKPARAVRLAVEDPQLRDELAALLRRERIDVEFVPLLSADSAAPADVVVVRPEDLEQGGEERLEMSDDEAPGVIVLGEQEGPTEQARMIAAGALAVLDTEDSEDLLRDQIVELARAEVDGGLDGPEAGGSQAEPKLADFQSRSPRMRDFLDVVRRIADSDSTLLITGETGVGKERLARAIHAESPRAAGPFVAVNCGALPENLLESELFGHERGAFTGATSTRQGRFEEAQGGTILLDEIGEMPHHMQVKLLTVLQRREIRRLGSEQPHPIDVRVLSATHRDLSQDVVDGRFREDLMFRLNVVALEVPPLRDRREDLPQLLGRFLRHFGEAHGRRDLAGFEPRAMAALLDYGWPGNVREVVNVVERAVLLSEGPRIGLGDLPAKLRGVAASSDASARATRAEPGTADVDDELFDLPLQEARRRIVEEFERDYLRRLLVETGGTVGEAAQRARINPRTLYEKMRRYGLDKSEFRS